MNKNLMTIGGAAVLTALALTGCSAGGDAAPPAETTAAAAPALADGTWLSVPIDESIGGPGTELHQTKLIVDGTDVRVSKVYCVGEETVLAPAWLDGDQLMIETEDGSPEAIKVSPASDDSFDASIRGYGYGHDVQFRAAEFKQMCG